MKTILLISPYWKEEHRWMVSSYKLAELWQKLGYRVVVVCMGAKTQIEEVSDTLKIYYKKDLFIPDPWNYGIAFGFTRLVRKVIRRENPDLIVANKILFWTSICLIPLRLTGKRVVLLTDALVGITWWPRGSIPKFCAAIYAWTLGWLIMLCSLRFVTFHPQPPKLLKKLFVEGKTQVIPTGIDESNYNSEISSQDKSNLTITYVGRLESVKGVDDFLAAVTPLTEDYQDLNVQVIGGYDMNHPLIKKYGDTVTFTGLRDDVPEILSKSDIFVLPSYSEGLSNALMEAMSSGCACVATEVGGNCFLIQNGVSGLLFPPGDQEALRAHVKRLIDDPSKRISLSENARKRIEAHFSWEHVGKKYKTLFDHLIAHG